MANVRKVQFAWTAGQVGTNFDFRSELEVYPKAARTLRNKMVRSQGGSMKRRGFAWVATLPGAKMVTTFRFSITQEYAFVWYDQRLKIFRNDAEVWDSDGVTTIPWTTAELSQIRFAQSFDTLWVVHENHPTKTIKRGATDSDWTVADYSFKFPPTQSFPDTDGWELQPSGTTGSITITATGGSGNLFDSTWQTLKLRINKGLVTLPEVIASPTNSVTATVDGNFALSGTGKDPAWEEQAFSSKRGYARTVGLHQSRLWFGGSRDLPQDYWGSQTGDFPNFDRGNGDADEGILDTVASQDVSTIFDMVPRKGLQIFTHTAEFIVQGEPVTPDASRASRQTTIGIASDVRPLSAGAHTIFLTRDKKELHLFRFDLDEDQFTTENLTLIAEDLLDQPVDMAFLQSYLDTQSDYVICVNTDGTISCLALNTDKGVQAWSTWDTNGKFKSVTVVD